MSKCARCGAPLEAEQEQAGVCGKCKVSWRRADTGRPIVRPPISVTKNTLVAADHGPLAGAMHGTLLPSAPPQPRMDAPPEAAIGATVDLPDSRPTLDPRATTDVPQSPSVQRQTPTVDIHGSPASSTSRPPAPAPHVSAGSGRATARDEEMKDRTTIRDPLVRERTIALSHDSRVQHADYELLEKIGEGGMGVVYRARQNSIRREVAIKQIKPSVAMIPESRAKFMREACFTGELAHPNIVPIHDLGCGSDGALFYAMKIVDGQRWDASIGQKSRQENLEILLNVADAIAFAHSRGVIHRDLKPENIMLGEFGEVLVMDWGLAAKHDGHHALSPGGSPAYMAPEMAVDYLRFVGQTGPFVTNASVGKHSDIYLLGAILFEIVVGKPPHEAEASANSTQMIISCLLNASQNIIAPVENDNDMLLTIARRAMATNPADRYASVLDFQQALREYQQHALSVGLVERAEEDLRMAADGTGYERYSRALFGFQDALDLWRENAAAHDGLRRTRLAYATAALDANDFELGMTVLDPQDEEQRKLHQRLERGARLRQHRERRLKVARLTAAAMLMVAACATAIGWYVSHQARLVADRQREIADKQREAATFFAESANDNLDFAIAGWDTAEQARKEADDNAVEMEKQRDKAQENEALAKAARDAANRERFSADIALASQLVAHDSASARDKLGKLLADATEMQDPTLVGWEWQRLFYRTHSEVKDVHADGQATRVAISPDGLLAVSAALKESSPIVKVWDVERQTATTVLEALPNEHLPIATVVGVAISADGRYVHAAMNRAANQPGLLVSWELASGKLSQIIDQFESLRPADGPWTIQHAVARRDVDGLITVHNGAMFVRGILWTRHGAALVPEQTWYKDLSVDVLAMPRGKELLFGRMQMRDGNDPFVQLMRYDLGNMNADRVIDFEKVHQEVSWDAISSLCLAPRPESFECAMGRESGAIVVRSQDPANPASATEYRLFGHDAKVTCLQYTADGGSLISADAHGVVLVWDVARRQVRQTLPGHRAAVDSMHVSRGDRTVLVTGDRDGILRFWDLENYRDEFRGLASPGTEFQVGAMTSDGTRVATANSHGLVTVANVHGNSPMLTHSIGHPLTASVQQAHYDPASNRVFTWSPGREGDVLCMWDAATGKQLWRELGLSPEGIFSVTPGGKYVVAAKRIAAKGDQWQLSAVHVDGEHQPMSISDDFGNIRAVLPLPVLPLQQGEASPRYVVVGYETGTIRVLDLQAPDGKQEVAVNQTGDRIRSIRQMILADDGRSIITIIENQNKRLLTEWTVDEQRRQTLLDAIRNAQGGSVRLYRLLQEELPFDPQLELQTRIRLATRGSLLCIARCDATGDAVGGNLWIRQIEGSQGFRKQIDLGALQSQSSNQVRDMTVMGDSTVCVLYADGAISRWTIGSASIVQMPPLLPKATRIVACRDDQLFAVAGPQCGLCRAADGRLLQAFGGQVVDMCWFSDEQLLATLRDDGLIRIWDLSAGRLKRQISVGQDARVIRILGAPDQDAIWGIVQNGATYELREWVADGEDTGRQLMILPAPVLAVARESNVAAILLANQQVVFWKSGSFEAYPFTQPDGSHATCLALSRDHDRLAIGFDNGEGIVYEHGAIGGSDTAAGTTKMLAPLYVVRSQRRIAAPLTALAFTPEGHRLVTGDESSAIRLWMLPQLPQDIKRTELPLPGKELLSFPGHTRRVSRLQFSSGDAPSLFSLDSGAYHVLFSAPFDKQYGLAKPLLDSAGR